MKKSTKGALAAGAAGVLLLGGAGSLAYWTDSATITGTQLTSGHLTVDAADCTDTDNWTLEGAAFNPATDTLIPGDELEMSCNLEVDVKGTHFTQVDIDATTPTAPAAPWDELTFTTNVQGSTTGADNVTVTQGVNNIPVLITVTWPYGTVSSPDANTGADNGLNGDLSTTLGDIAVTVVQDHETDAN